MPRGNGGTCNGSDGCAHTSFKNFNAVDKHRPAMSLFRCAAPRASASAASQSGDQLWRGAHDDAAAALAEDRPASQACRGLLRLRLARACTQPQGRLAAGRGSGRSGGGSSAARSQCRVPPNPPRGEGSYRAVPLPASSAGPLRLPYVGTRRRSYPQGRSARRALVLRPCELDAKPSRSNVYKQRRPLPAAPAPLLVPSAKLARPDRVPERPDRSRAEVRNDPPALRGSAGCDPTHWAKATRPSRRSSIPQLPQGHFRLRVAARRLCHRRFPRRLTAAIPKAETRW